MLFKFNEEVLKNSVILSQSQQFNFVAFPERRRILCQKWMTCAHSVSHIGK